MVAMVDNMLHAAPCLPTARPQWTPAPLPSRVAIRASVKPAALRVSCCSGATTSTSGEAVEKTEEVGSKSSAPFGEVYVASVSLRAPKGVAEILHASQDVQLFADFQHYMTIIKPNKNGGASCTVLDFQPRDPENPLTAVKVLLGNPIPGVILERTLSRLPSQRCWWVGEMKPGLSLEDALEFSKGYDSELSLGVNDCRHHTLDLVEFLTGKRMLVIEQVRDVRERERLLAEELAFEKTLAEASSAEESSDLETIEEPAEETIEEPAEETIEELAEETTVKTAA